MVGQGQWGAGSVGIPTRHRNVLLFANDGEAELIESPEDFALWRVDRELGH